MVYTDFLSGKYKEWMRELKEHWFLIFISLIIFLIAAVIDYYAGFYVTYGANVSNVSDLILDYFGPFNLSFIFVYGWLFCFAFLFFYTLFFRAKKLHTVIFHVSLLTILRSIFIILTHLQTPIDAIPAKFPLILNLLRFTNDQFFSGHVSLIFLGFFLFQDNKKLRYFFLISSIIMAITVLAMHQHYSIDVFAAFFITYGCYHIGEWLIRKFKFHI